MRVGSRVARLTFLMWLVVLSGSVANAQGVTSVGPRRAWALGLSGGLWGSVPVDSKDPRPSGKAFDLSVERLVGVNRPGALAIRVQGGTGLGDAGRKPGFNYRRLVIGVVRTSTSASSAPFTVYWAAGGGAYRAASSRRSDTVGSVYGAFGLDVALGSGVTSIGAELQLQALDGGLYGTTSLSARLHFR